MRCSEGTQRQRINRRAVPRLANPRSSKWVCLNPTETRQPADVRRSVARNDQDREAWFRVAQGWLSLLKKTPTRTAQDAFDQLAADKGGRQDESKSSHQGRLSWLPLGLDPDADQA